MLSKVISFFLVAAVVLIFSLLRQKPTVLGQPEDAWSVQDESGKITCLFPDKTSSEIRWEELQKVQIETNDRGPVEPDVFWVLSSATAVCKIPQGSLGEEALRKKLIDLPGFNLESFASAALSTENRVFELWGR